MSVYLSNIELYYTKPENIQGSTLVIDDSDVKHILKVMRHKIGDILFVTNGKGKIYEGEIKNINNDTVKIKPTKVREYNERFKNLTVCIPNIKKQNRLEFAIEKATELGITNFIIFNSKRTINKKIKIERLNKVVLSAMKQSLNSYLPKITFFDSTTFLYNTNSEIILFEQNVKNKFSNPSLKPNQKYYLLFGPEGGFEKEEIPNNLIISNFNLAPNRLRTETAVVCAVSKI